MVYGIEATLPIDFEVESSRVAIGTRLNDLEELNEKRRRAAQHMEAIQRRRKVIFDKRHKKRALERGMLVMLQDGKKKDFPVKFDAIWLGPYILANTWPKNSV